MSETQTAERVSQETWESYKAALENLLAEAAPNSANGSGGGPGGPHLPDDELKHVVSEAVGAVLLESNLFEKVILRSIQKLSDDARKQVQEALIPQDAIRRICEEAFRSMTLHHLLPAVQKQMSEKMQTQLQSQLADLGKSEEFKGLIDSRFRVMEQYLRSDVIPKVIHDALGK